MNNLKKYLPIVIILALLVWILVSFILSQKNTSKSTTTTEVTSSQEGTSTTQGDNLKNSSHLEEGIQVGQVAVDFTLTNSQGEEVSLSDYRGKKVLLNFWASWCGPCREEMPAFEEFAKENPDIVILGVNLDMSDQKASADGLVQELNITYPILYGTKDLAKTYQVQYLPTNLFIDEDGVIKQSIFGSISKDVLVEEFGKF